MGETHSPMAQVKEVLEKYAFLDSHRHEELAIWICNFFADILLFLNRPHLQRLAPLDRHRMQEIILVDPQRQT